MFIKQFEINGFIVRKKSSVMSVFQTRKDREKITLENFELEKPESHKLIKSNEVVIESGNVDLGLKLKLDDLKTICSLKGAEALAKINISYGSVENLGKLLKTNLQDGLDETNKEDMKQRMLTYGRNEIPTSASKPFYRLVLDAFKDPTLTMLSLCAAISIGLAFYHTSDKIKDASTNFNSSDSLPASYNTSNMTHLTSSNTSEDDSNIQWIEGT